MAYVPVTYRQTARAERAPSIHAAIRAIQQVVGDRYAVTVEALAGPRRTKDLALARHLAMWAARRLVPHASLPQIGEAFGDRDHTSVLYAVAKVWKLHESGEPEPGIVLELARAALAGRPKARKLREAA